MAALATYSPNYKQYYQYRSYQPYYLFASEREWPKRIARAIIPQAAVSETAANILGIPALFGYTGAVAYSDYKSKRMAEEARRQRELDEDARMVRLITASERIPSILAPPSADVVEIEEDISPAPPMQQIVEQPQPTDTDVKIDFEPPPRRYVRDGPMSNSTLDDNISKIRGLIKIYGYKRAMGDPNVQSLAGYDLLTSEGLRDALFDPNRYIPKSIQGIVSPRVAKALDKPSRMKLHLTAGKPGNSQIYEKESRDRYFNDIRREIATQNKGLAPHTLDGMAYDRLQYLLGKQ